MYLKRQTSMNRNDIFWKHIANDQNGKCLFKRVKCLLAGTFFALNESKTIAMTYNTYILYIYGLYMIACIDGW